MVKTSLGPAEAPVRPRNSDARERLLASASQLMCELNTILISIRDVADHSKLNSSLIRYYFGNKDRLLVEVAKHDILPVIEDLQRIASMDDSARQRFEDQIRCMVVALHRYPYIFRLILQMTRDFEPEHVEEVIQTLHKPIYDALARVLKDGVASGEFEDLDPGYTIFGVTGACAHIFSLRAIFQYQFGVEQLSPEQRDDFANVIIKMALGGLDRES